MIQKIRNLGSAVAVAALTATGAQAGGVPVIDATAIAQFVQQLDQMQQDYENQVKQLASLTGSKGIGSILNTNADQTKRTAAESLSSIMGNAISGTSLTGNTSVITSRISELKDTFELNSLSTMLSSDVTQDRAVATQAGSGLAAVATAEDTYQRANASMERINGMISDIDSNEDLKASVDYNTRMLAEVAVLLNENLRVQAAAANAVGTNAIASARDRAAQRRFLQGEE